MVRWRTRWRGGGPVPCLCAGARVPCRSGGCFRGCTTSWIPTSGRSEPESRGRGGEGIGPGHTFSVGIVSAPSEEPDELGRTARATAVFDPSRAGQHKGRPHAITPDPLARPLVRPRWRGSDPGVVRRLGWIGREMRAQEPLWGCWGLVGGLMRWRTGAGRGCGLGF